MTWYSSAGINLPAFPPEIVRTPREIQENSNVKLQVQILIHLNVQDSLGREAKITLHINYYVM
jgi:hypothetical protein